MFQRSAVLAIILALPGTTSPGTTLAQSVPIPSVPERVLPRGSQLYLRWDGVEAHRAAFNQSAVGKTLQGDVGTFFSGLMTYLDKQVDALAGPGNAPTAEVIREVAPFLRSVGKNGFRLGVCVRKIVPPDVEAMVVFPKAAKEHIDGRGGILALLRKGAALSGMEVKEIKKAGRTVYHADGQFIQLGWWTEGDDAVVVVGTQPPEDLLKKTKQDFTSSRMYQQLKSFKEFATWSDGFVDVAGLAKVVGQVSPEIERLIDDLGLKGVKGITFHSGFDGPAERSVLLIDMPGPRKGVLKIAGQRQLTLKDLPPMPPDLTYFTASNLDLVAVYDAVVGGIESVVRIFAPGQANAVKEGIKSFEGAVGVKLRDDLFGSLGDMVVYYNSAAEGPLGLGAVYLVKVKDAKKLSGALDNLVKVAATIPFIEINVKKRPYRGVDIHEIHLGTIGNFQLPSYLIHKDWLAFSSYPQPLKGYVLRSQGELPAWKAPPALAKRLEAFPKEFVGLSVSDPRPGMKLVLSLAPVGITLLNSFLAQAAPDARFDVNLIPNAHEATRHLFPNITVTTDDGKTIRIETRASLALPFFNLSSFNFSALNPFFFGLR